MDEYLPLSRLLAMEAFRVGRAHKSWHLQFALKGCLRRASVTSVYDSIAWRVSTRRNDMPADGAFHDRRISPETDFAFRRRLGGWLSYRDGFADIILPYLDSIAEIHLFFRTCHRRGCLVLTF